MIVVPIDRQGRIAAEQQQAEPPQLRPEQQAAVQRALENEAQPVQAVQFQLGPEQQAAVQDAIANRNVVVYQQINNPPAQFLQHLGNGFCQALGTVCAALVAKVSWEGMKALFFYGVEEISRRQAMKWLAKEAAKKAIGVQV